ncbi:MAG: hypothetical protein WKF34_12705 [Pyrinomonadaceae bacterium]
MIYHVLPGDSLVGEFEKLGLDGKKIVFREALIAGPIDAPDLDDFWNQRAHFVLAEYGEDEIVYHETVADELSALIDVSPDDEVNLWFEYELFCSVNLWFSLSLLRESGAAIYRVQPMGLTSDDRWKGFGGIGADALTEYFDGREKLSRDDVKLGADLWTAYKTQDFTTLRQLGKANNPRFPYLREVCDAAAKQKSLPLEILGEITASGQRDFAEIFRQFQEKAGVYGFGDLQVSRLLDQMGTR